MLIAPPLAYEYFNSHATLKTLADRLAARGYTVVRFDYRGTGDSAGAAWDLDRVTCWRQSVSDVAQAMRDAGCTRLHVVGLRLGATLALELPGIDDAVAWAPVLSGKRWMRELRMLGIPTQRPGFVFAGTVFSDDTVSAMATVNLTRTSAKRVLLLQRPAAPLTTLETQLREANVEVTLDNAEGTDAFLDQPSEDAVVPSALLERIATWLTPAEPGKLAFRPQERTQIPWSGESVEESFVEVAGMPAIRGNGRPGYPTVLFLNSGSEVHIGPGRAWVEFGRAFNRAGFHTLRVDWPGWGENVERDIGRPYDRHSFDATLALVEALPGERVILSGLCAGAWTAVKAAQTAEVAGVLAFSAPLFWEHGRYPVIARIDEAMAWRNPERDRQRRLGQLGVWSLLDALHVRPRAAKWLSGLTRRRIKTLLLYSTRDDGLVYLEHRLARRLKHELRRKVIEVAELTDLDHQMYREWRHDEIIATSLRFLNGFVSAPSA